MENGAIKLLEGGMRVLGSAAERGRQAHQRFNARWGVDVEESEGRPAGEVVHAVAPAMTDSHDWRERDPDSFLSFCGITQEAY